MQRNASRSKRGYGSSGTGHLLCGHLCNKGVTNGFPLRVEFEQVEVIESEFRPEFLKTILRKIDYGAFYGAATALNVAAHLPTELSEKEYEDEEILKHIHHALFDVHVKKGSLICPESNRVFPIVDGIPNMLLNDDEV